MLALLWKFKELILIVAVISAVGWLTWDYQHTKESLAQAQITVKEQSDTIKTLKDDMATYKVNVGRLDLIEQRQNDLIAGQKTVKERMKNVPTSKSDRPFADPGLLERARIMRDYQNSRQADSQD